MYCVLVVISSIQSNGRSESVTSLVAQHCWHWPFRWPLPCPWLKQTAIDHHSQSYWLSKAVCLIVCKSRQSKANKTTVTFLFHRLLQWLICPWCVAVPLFKTSVWQRSHITERHFWSANRWPSTSVPHSLLFSLATITINSSTSEGSEEQLINHMHPLLVSWRPSWLYWSVSLILHCFDSLFSHPFS